MPMSEIMGEPEDMSKHPNTPESEGTVTKHDFTPDELYELIAKQHIHESFDDGALTETDIMLIYKNMDLGTQLMADTRQCIPRSNQYVEDVKYHGDNNSDISETSSDNSSEDCPLCNINKNSLPNILCSKCCNFNVNNQSTDFASDYNNDIHPVIRDPHIQEQIRDLGTKFNNTILPISLLDIFCKHLEDNYNFDMDNIIAYVNNTIEQLKRISNGENLSQAAKERWIEVGESPLLNNSVENMQKNKVFTTSMKMPLMLNERKTGTPPTWDEIVHSELDLKLLCKALENKITLEVPKAITDSYNLFSKSYENVANNNLNKGQGFNVSFQIQPSPSGHFVSNVEAFVLVQGNTISLSDIHSTSAQHLLSLSSAEHMNTELRLENRESLILDNNAKVVEIDNNNHQEIIDTSRDPDKVYSDSSNTTISFIDTLGKTKDSITLQQSLFNPSSPDNLMITIHRLRIQSSILEEVSEENLQINQEYETKCNTELNLKTPYHNKANVLTENRRKRLLEIRDNREKKKLKKMFEKSPSKYNKCAKGVFAPAPSSSVTKLSISNKSFYNSIYGQNPIMNKAQKHKSRRKTLKRIGRADPKLTAIFEKPPTESLNFLLNNNIPKGLDFQKKNFGDVKLDIGHCENKAIVSNISGVVDDSVMNALKKVKSSVKYSESLTSMNLADLLLERKRSLENIIAGNYKSDVKGPIDLLHITETRRYKDNRNNSEHEIQDLTADNSSLQISTDDSKMHLFDDRDRGMETKHTSQMTLECKESIGKIYELMKTMGKTNNVPNSKLAKTKFTKSSYEKQRTNASFQESDSGTSVKYQSSTSFMSNFSIPKLKKPRHIQENTINVPKIIISSKSPTKSKELNGCEAESSKERKIESNQILGKSISRNPITTIAQLLHEVDTIQKNKNKMQEVNAKRPNVQSNVHRKSRLDQHLNKFQVSSINQILSKVEKLQNSKDNAKSIKARVPDASAQIREKDRRSRLDQHIKEREVDSLKNTMNRNITQFQMRDKKDKIPQFRIAPPLPVDRYRPLRKKISDIIDEEKEARGEAVRGPSKNITSSRLDTLAQPKKAYVQAHSEQFKNKYGRNIISDRLHRLVNQPPPSSLTRARPKVVTHWREKAVTNDIRSTNSAKIAEKPIKQIYARRTSSSPVSRTMSSLVIEEPNKKTVSFGLKDMTYQPEEKSKNVVTSYLESQNANINRNRNERTNLQAVRNTYIPFIPRNSKSGDFLNKPVAVKSVHEIYRHVLNSDLSGCLTEISEKFYEDSAIEVTSNPGDVINKNAIVKVKNGILTIDPDDLIDKDIVHFITEIPNRDGDKSNMIEVKIDNTIRAFTNDKLLAEVSTKLILENLECVLSEHSSRTFDKRQQPKHLNAKNVYILQSGDASSMLKVKAKTSQHITDQIVFNVKSSRTTLNEVNRLNTFTHDIPLWDIKSIPMQISTVGYSFPFLNKFQPKEFERKVYSQGNMLNFATELPSEYNVCTHFEQSKAFEVSEYQKLDQEEKSEVKTFQHKEIDSIDRDNYPISEDDNSIPVSSNVDCTNSLDVLVSLLNEIHNISMRQTHIASTVGFSAIEHEKPLHFATSYNMQSTMQNVVSYDLVTISSEKELDKIEPYGSLYSLYVSDEGNLIEEEELQTMYYQAGGRRYKSEETSVEKKLISQCTDTNSASLIPMLCKGTSVTNLLLNFLNHTSENALTVTKSNKCAQSTINLLNENAKLYSNKSYPLAGVENADSKQIISFYKRHDALVDSIDKNEKRGQYVETSKDEVEILNIKRDFLLSLYAVLILAVFAAMSYPEILSLQN